MHRPTSPLMGWQNPASNDWKRLGPKGDNWRLLCNKLLLVDVSPDTISLEALSKELARLTPRSSKHITYSVLAVVSLALLGLGLGIYFWLVIWPAVQH